MLQGDQELSLSQAQICQGHKQGLAFIFFITLKKVVIHATFNGISAQLGSAA